MKIKIKNAIISLSDKSKIDSLIKILMRYRINVICSGGTYKKIIQKYGKADIIVGNAVFVKKYQNLLVLKKCWMEG